MREILYIQAGMLSNYVGTHFWNTQEAYLSDETDDATQISHVTSFGEEYSRQGELTCVPRLLAFDKKSNFGAVASTHVIHDANPNNPSVEDDLETDGGVLEYRQDLITPRKIDDEDSTEAPQGDEVSLGNERHREPIRYWSDFSRVYYTRKSIQMVPQTLDWESTEGDWKQGEQYFRQFDEDASLLEGSVRLFLEESDSVQGVQVLNDTASFGPFMHSLLTALHDDMLKIPCLVFPLLSDPYGWKIDVEDRRGTRRLINDALYLRGLSETASLTVPIQSPSVWAHYEASPQLKTQNDLYHTSGIICAHIESSTLPLRLRKTADSISSFCSQLNVRGPPYAEICGITTITSAEQDLKSNIFNFSDMERFDTRRQYSRRDVTRGFTTHSLGAYDQWSARSSLHDMFITRTHAPAYPVPPALVPQSPLSWSRSGPTPVETFSSVSTSSGTARMFADYAKFVDSTLRRRTLDVVVPDDIDDLKELANDLWTVCDSLSKESEEEESGTDSGLLGEDEEL
ncbi:mtDNA inheritance protein Dml1 [Guyanagaster necrorhizus]|uniref:MtDNA inheritance protein Dml1 n=1 Tax=Guyanagaster necrorhizus TaxID=856835 RepID=A0A9P8ARE5_9AGAR|nr:mtDNA inheritance protein Dml1 [Guyanagaster necrorhizus MCA 3950]KAG7443782.1 mtDNA inheritance protein Dml1 [Guyanagaster necrorhizus MCA 3950]